MADVNVVESERRKKREFYTDLEQYYRRKWNATLKIPYINGRPVDFYILYQKVTALGGWSKVSNWNRWNDVVDALNIPVGCAASEHAVKIIYMRYLSKFEQSQLFGETDGDNGDGPGSSLGGRSQRGRLYLSSLGGQAGVSPFTSRFASSALPDHIHSNVSTSAVNNILEGAQCDRLVRSLKSGLPNEVDFAINICMILSSPPNASGCQASLRLNETPIIIDLLLAHVGVFDEGVNSYRQFYKDSWKDYNPGRNFENFWLSYADNNDDMIKTLLKEIGDNEEEQEESSVENSLFGNLSLPTKDRLTMAKRVDQVGNILRNFSFEADCRCAMANNRTMIRYLLIAINCQNVSLQSMALDTLSNVASEMNLDEIDPYLLRLLMSTISRCLHSEDKFHIVRALESIGNLCCNERNETLLCEYLEPSVIRRMIALLAVKDIMMCVYLLECLYQMTEIGQIPCQRLAEQPRAVDTLVQLVTVEAVSFGPNGLLGMKVVEYGMPSPHTAILPHPTKTAPVLSMNSNFDSLSTSTIPAVKMLRPNMEVPLVATAQIPATTIVQQQPPPFLARPVRPAVVGGALLASPTSAGSSRTNAPIVAQVVQQQTPTPVSSQKKEKSKAESSKKIATNSVSTVASTPSGAAYRGPAVTVQQDQHVEQLTMNWLRQNCSSDPTSRVSRGEIYTSYVQDMRRLYDSIGVSVTAFTNYARQMFPSCAVRQLENTTNGGSESGTTSNCRGNTLLQFDGIKFTSRNMVKNNLISPSSSSSSSTSPPLSQVVAQHPLMQQILLAGSEKQNVGNSMVIGSPVLPKTPNSSIAGGATTTNVIRARSDSAGTLDSGYSLPGTPDSLSSSGFSGTNSSTGFVGATNFAGGPQRNSPKSQKKTPSKLGNKKTFKNRSSTPALPDVPVVTTTTTTDNGLVNGSISDNDTVNSTDPTNSTTTTTAESVCHLEVCHAAQEARTVIETGDTHEARIVRVENTIAMVSSQFYLPDPNLLLEPTTPKIVNGETSRHSENSNGCDLNDKNSVTSISNEDINLSKPTTKKPAKKKSTIVGKSTPVNGLIKSMIGNETGSNSLVSSGSSPSPDMETMKQNVNQSIQSIQELLAGGSADGVKLEKEEVVDGNITKSTPTKKGGSGKKRKATSTSTDGVTVDEKPPPKKKKYYPKKKKNPNQISTTAPPKGNDDSFSQASTSSDPMANASFRLPLPPTRSQSPHLVQQTVITSPGSISSGSQMIVRIPPPPVGRLKYVCEWDGCGRDFGSSNAVYYHVAKTHINDDSRVCQWTHCDQTMRLRWSLVAHIQDIHCNEQTLRTAAIRRYDISMCGHSNVPEPRTPPPHPGYPNDAAVVAIRRHALVNLAKEIVDESEGPVTKSIRLTSSLILRNLARYSADGRRVLRKYERKLSYLAFSRLESSAALAQCLSELTCSTSLSPSKEMVIENGDADSI